MAVTGRLCGKTWKTHVVVGVSDMHCYRGGFRSCSRLGPDALRAAPWGVEAGPHLVVQMGVDAYSCEGCGSLADAAHPNTMAAATCPVPAVSRDGEVWADGARALASLFGRIAVFRRCAEPDPVFVLSLSRRGPILLHQCRRCQCPAPALRCPSWPVIMVM